MTDFRIEEVQFDREPVDTWSELDPRFKNWPVVYMLNGNSAVYVGESLNVASRFRQHLDNLEKQNLENARVVIDDTFNKSACLDLESYLIRLFAGDGKFEVLNLNEGISDREYFGREEYQRRFAQIFEELKREGLFAQSIVEIQNSDLFKLSPFKALTEDQAMALVGIVEDFFDDLEHGMQSRAVIQGEPGTGKTVVAIYLLKLLTDIKNFDPSIPVDGVSVFSDFFVPGYPELLSDVRIGIVIPQQALRKSIERVFKKTPGLNPEMVMSPFDIGKRNERFDLLVVDEAHRLSQRARQGSGVQNKDFRDINVKIFGRDDVSYTQLDWIKALSDHQIYLVDAEQTVRPGDLPSEYVLALTKEAKEESRWYRLNSQHRVRAGDDYVGYVRGVLNMEQQSRKDFSGYDLRFFDSFYDLHAEIMKRESEHGLARIISGYAWEWKSQKDPNAFDIEIDGIGMKWNTTTVDWVNSKTSIDEVGVIHTIQGYDLNFAGVIIGNDLKIDPLTRKVSFDRNNYYDSRGKSNNKQLGITYSDEDLLKYVQNIYAVLLTRGIMGTYVHVCDPALREYLRKFF